MRKIFLICLMLSLLVFAGCSTGKNQEETGTEPVQLTVGTMPSIDKVPMLIGVEQGFFEQYGVDVEVLNFQSPTDRDAALQSGQLDGIMSDMVAAIYYLQGGQSVKMTSLIQTDFVILASEESGITGIEDISADTVNGISLNGLIEYIADQAGSAEKILLPSVMNRVEQIVSGEIDLTIVPEPYGSMAVSMGAVKVATAADLDIYGAVMLFTDDAIAAKADAIAGFYKGYEDAVNYLASADPAEYIDAVIEKGEFSPDIAALLEATEFYSLEAPAEEQFVSIQDWLNEKQEEGIAFQFDFGEITDFSFLEQ